MAAVGKVKQKSEKTKKSISIFQKNRAGMGTARRTASHHNNFSSCIEKCRTTSHRIRAANFV